jgi:hypothetical protein
MDGALENIMVVAKSIKDWVGKLLIVNTAGTIWL